MTCEVHDDHTVPLCSAIIFPQLINEGIQSEEQIFTLLTTFNGQFISYIVAGCDVVCSIILE